MASPLSTFGGFEARVELALGDFQLRAQVESGAELAGPVVVIGPNGSGKTSLLGAIVGVVPCQAGRVVIGGTVVFDAAVGSWLPPEAREVGYVPQGFGLFPHLTALENVAFGLEARGAGSRAERREMARAALSELAVLDCEARLPSALSGGQTQRVALARALVTEPKLLLLDEPLSSLDVRVRRALRTHLADKLAQAGRPSLIVTHDANVAAYASRQIRVLDGKIYEERS